MTGFKRVEDNIDRTPQGRYRARYRDANGRRRAKTFDRLTGPKGARAFLKTMNGDVARGEWMDPAHGKRPFSDAVDLWRGTWVNLKPKTKARHNSLLTKHVLPEFGSVQLGRIEHATIQRYIGALTEDYAPSTVGKVLDAIRGPLNAAVKAGWLRVNPAQDVKLPRVPRGEVLFLTAEQVRDLAEAITPRYRTLIYFAAYTGLRAGEIGGLRVKDIDLLRRVVHVRRTLVDVDGRLEFGTPKNHQERTVGLPVFLAEMVAADLAARPSRPTGDDLVFTGDRGGPLRHANFRRRHFQLAVRGKPESKRRRGTAGHPAIPAALPEELAGLRFHDLRHTTAALLIAQGAHPKAIQERLGHHSITITMDRYGHLFPSLHEQLTEGLDATFHAATAAPTVEVMEIR